MNAKGIWLNVWFDGGYEWFHSRLGDIKNLNKIVRCDINASQIIKMNIIIDKNEIIDPIDEITFHDVYISG